VIEKVPLPEIPQLLVMLAFQLVVVLSTGAVGGTVVTLEQET
jgi:hypothetical protein